MCIRDRSSWGQYFRRIAFCYKIFEFLKRILTCDETWIHYFEPESKRQSMEWKHPSLPAKKKFKPQPSAGKVMLTIFWSSQGPIFCNYLQDHRTINSQYYSDMIANKVKPALKKKCPGWQSKGVILLHDNARPHTAKLTLETIKKLGWEILPHPPYSPDPVSYTHLVKN